MCNVPVVDRDQLTRMQVEYIQMPGLRLTSRQAQRLWNLTPSVCDELLTILVRQGFLAKTDDGIFFRHVSITHGALRPAALRYVPGA
jgi:hypothetical protein